MAKEQTQFWKRVREAWKKEFPFLKLVDLDEIPRLPKSSNFCCDDYFSSRGVCYFVTIDFSARRHGEFMVGITVSPSREKSVLNPSTYNPPSPSHVGSYNLAEFLDRQSCRRWDLVDVDAKTSAICNELGIPMMTLLDHAAADVWKPSSYSLPFDQIADEAIHDVSDKLRRFVFPKLEITIESKG